jgi:hypothetical protein
MNSATNSCLRSNYSCKDPNHAPNPMLRLKANSPAAFFSPMNGHAGMEIGRQADIEDAIRHRTQ